MVWYCMVSYWCTDVSLWNVGKSSELTGFLFSFLFLFCCVELRLVYCVYCVYCVLVWVVSESFCRTPIHPYTTPHTIYHTMTDSAIPYIIPYYIQYHIYCITLHLWCAEWYGCLCQHTEFTSMSCHLLYPLHFTLLCYTILSYTIILSYYIILLYSITLYIIVHCGIPILPFSFSCSFSLSLLCKCMPRDLLRPR